MSDLTRVSSKELVRNFGPLSDKALTEPVAITRNGRDRLVLLSVEEYVRLKRRDRSVHDVADLSDATLDALLGRPVRVQRLRLARPRSTRRSPTVS